MIPLADLDEKDRQNSIGAAAHEAVTHGETTALLGMTPITTTPGAIGDAVICSGCHHDHPGAVVIMPDVIEIEIYANDEIPPVFDGMARFPDGRTASFRYLDGRP
jgi:hypothetical protein